MSNSSRVGSDVEVALPRLLAAQLLADIAEYRTLDPVDDLGWLSMCDALDRVTEGLREIEARLLAAAA